jgi:hypothetical protein
VAGALNSAGVMRGDAVDLVPFHGVVNLRRCPPKGKLPPRGCTPFQVQLRTGAGLRLTLWKRRSIMPAMTRFEAGPELRPGSNFR